MAVITFSREPYSGTRDLARLLAERLGYRYVSRDELTQAVNARSGIQRTTNAAESEGRALTFFEQLGEQLTGDGAAYKAELQAIITELAMADNVVLVGHGAGLFLRGLRTVVRVFVVAPMDDRVARVMAEGEVDPERAKRVVAEEDRESAAYLRYLGGIDWQDPHHWDLVINTGHSDMNAVVDMLAHYAESLVRTLSEQDSLDRLQLARRVEEALLVDTELGVANLHVRVESAAVVLEGEALAQEDRVRAEAIAVALAPQTAVENRIVVHPPSFT